MAKTVKDMLAQANESVPKISVLDAQKLIKEQHAVLVDVRDEAELLASGKAKGALHIPRGMLEFRADETTPYHDKHLLKTHPVIVYCAAGGRAALSAKTLQDMGYDKVYNLGGLKDWVEGGGEIEKVAKDHFIIS